MPLCSYFFQKIRIRVTENIKGKSDFGGLPRPLQEQVVLGHKTSFEALKTQLAAFTGTQIVRRIRIDANLKRIKSILENIG
ncbi:hypothetical protein AU378_04005 [Chryseobacterium kwangjuense]|uniref:Uncharacterized protein n=1 Tax=Chryseobacterium kwangjuense TaxID=267125 RepID=A0A135WJ27_9FLAO|nr:hypothetical protein AU378_04005 [Chryseobacterium kwangjuense]